MYLYRDLDLVLVDTNVLFPFFLLCLFSGVSTSSFAIGGVRRTCPDHLGMSGCIDCISVFICLSSSITVCFAFGANESELGGNGRFISWDLVGFIRGVGLSGNDRTKSCDGDLHEIRIVRNHE